jgi:hypothetical protein
MAAEPFTIGASLTLPPDTGQPNETLSSSFTGTFANATQQKLNIKGFAAAHAVSFGTLGTVAKMVWIENEKPPTGTPFPLQVSINGGASIAVAAGGFLVVSNPRTDFGPGDVASLSLTSSSDCTVRVVLLS